MKKHKILLVDDDTDDQFFFLDAINSINESLQCEVANNGVEAIDHLQKIPPPPSLIFLDLNMPMMNGYECLERIKKLEKFSQIPVIIFTTSNNPKDRELTKKLGAKIFLTKTSDFRQLQFQLSEILKLELN
ncbi:MAG TPA: response regulator [Flavobacterium sp.]|nr:response regulator [Flavobacterium sp.]